LAYSRFLTAVREYVAFALGSSAKIEAQPHPTDPRILIPILDEAGTKYRQQLDAAHVGVRLVASSGAIVEKAHSLARAARQAVASRATSPSGLIPSDTYTVVWSIERDFVDAVRAEIGLPALDLHEI
jgi:hypothetical protein